MQKKGVAQRGFLIAAFLVVGALIFASQLNPSDSSTGQIVTKSNLESELNTVLEVCSECPDSILVKDITWRTIRCDLKQSCPESAFSCGMYSCVYDCYKSKIFIKTHSQQCTKKSPPIFN